MMGVRKDVKLYREGGSSGTGRKNAARRASGSMAGIGEVHTLRKMCDGSPQEISKQMNR